MKKGIQTSLCVVWCLKLLDSNSIRSEKQKSNVRKINKIKFVMLFRQSSECKFDLSTIQRLCQIDQNLLILDRQVNHVIYLLKPLLLIGWLNFVCDWIKQEVNWLLRPIHKYSLVLNRYFWNLVSQKFQFCTHFYAIIRIG